MEQRIYTCPILDTTHLCQMWISCIQHPLRERIEQNICCKTTGEHHGAPRKEGILRLLILLAKDDIIEVDNLSELIALDASYKKYVEEK